MSGEEQPRGPQKRSLNVKINKNKMLFGLKFRGRPTKE
jgi:hypothetical protein